MDTNSPPDSPEAPPQDLWSSILDSVSSSRTIPSKQVLILGQPSTGKSTLASALLNKPPADAGKDEPRTDFALGYDWADVRDEDDTLARLSVYTVPSSARAYTSLVPHFLPPRAPLAHTVIVIVLDWTRPWTFIEDLLTWLGWVEAWAKGDASREGVIAREENRERLHNYLQHYTEPSADPIPATASAMEGTALPLGPGTLTHNAGGVPIVVACTKADLIDGTADSIAGAGASGMGGMVKGKGGEWEERTDGIMQILRTICLKYGAALFYTTQQPTTLQTLRQYALHMLFLPPAPTPDGGAPPRNPFPFEVRPNALDRDRIVVPAGWDSWGKIGVLRDGFDARAWGEAWERELENASESGGADEPRASRMYAALVPDQGHKPPPLPPFNNPTPEQAFLAKNYDENSRRPDNDPRGIFRQPADTQATGVVGPLGSTSFGLPAVERALDEMESGVALLGAARAKSTAAKAGPAFAGTSLLSVDRGGAAPVPRSPTTPTMPGTPGAGSTSNHEVLHNFFQSLLSSKDRAGASAAAAHATRANGGGSGSGTEDG
ncbi:dynein light intermediate chain-domain-containing protein [Vararia minispora EC-137]|uniref:Dynein light intermediate chain-domain-containing protein n=1 Tax=Vararia minispora EC-137 TaxID=1314806 RepID=A0ACB8QB65_9AGAM|nr:dynein light intermediate chain-domain-containing protein [Vararia minispora EC-137]